MSDGESLDLALIPEWLHPYLVEKLNYVDFAVFNGCNKLSSEMCRAVPRNARLAIIAHAITVSEDGEVNLCFLENGEQVKLSEIPEQVSIESEFFRAKGASYPHVVDIMKRFKVTAKEVVFKDLMEEPDYIQQLTEILNPRRFVCMPANNTTMSLEALRKVSELIRVDDEGEDPYGDALLELTAKDINIRGSLFEMGTAAKFIQQWVDGTRSITRAHLVIEDFTFEDFLSLLNNVSGTAPEIPDDPTKIYICRSENHCDCIAADVVMDWGNDIAVLFSGTTEKCPCPSRVCESV